MPSADSLKIKAVVEQLEGGLRINLNHERKGQSMKLMVHNRIEWLLPCLGQGNKAGLSFSQLEILVYMALGCSYEQTAFFLGISVHTVRTYLRQVLEKLGARGRTHAVMLALRKGLLDLETLRELERPKELEVDWTWRPLVDQILTLVALGYHNKDIGLALSYSEQHIKNIVHLISDKLGARNRVHLMILALIQRQLDFPGLGMDVATE